MPPAWLIALVPIAVIVVVVIVGTITGRRRGYNFGGDVVVRCTEGHLFTTIWVPGVSLKAVRLGWFRFQRCPVGEHWAFVYPVRTRTSPKANGTWPRGTATGPSPDAHRQFR